MIHKIYITESQLKAIINDMAYPKSFDMNKFASLNTFKDRVQYCNNNLDRISSGSSRIVYKIDETKVLKLAKNNKGISQNYNESDPYAQSLTYIAKCFKSDEHGLWNEMELAKPVKESDFEKIYGFTFSQYCYFLDYEEDRLHNKINDYNKKFFDENKGLYDKIVNSDFALDIIGLIVDMDYAFGDFKKLNSYGKVIRNGKELIVVVDYGATNNTIQQYYK